MELLDVDNIVHILEGLAADVGGTPMLRVLVDDERFDWDALEDGRDPATASPFDVEDDCRWYLPAGQSLHGRWDDDGETIVFHIDRFDPTRSPTMHMLAESWLPVGVMAGGFVGGLLMKGARGTLAGAAIGAALGAMVRGSGRTVWIVTHLGPHREWRARQVEPLPDVAAS